MLSSLVQLETDPVTYSVVDLAKAVRVAIDTRTHTFELWNAFFTKKDATDSQLIALTDATNGVQKSRIGIIEWDNYRFGKTIARICLTPFNQEAGFIKYPGLISFRMDWLDLLAVQGTLKSLLL